MINWPLKYRIWRFLHYVTNFIALKFTNDFSRRHMIWRLNSYFADRYIYWELREKRKVTKSIGG